MLAVPEDDDDIENSTSAESIKPIIEGELKRESSSLVSPPLLPPLPPPPSSLPSIPVASTEQIEAISSKIQTSGSVSESVYSKQHRSRRSLFHRNTIHICDQIVDRVASHQQHHSAPPAQTQQSKTGLQSINENSEFLPLTQIKEHEQNRQQHIINSRFPRSNTVPCPVYATFRKTGGNTPPTQYYYTDYPSFLYGTISSPQANIYYNTRQPVSSINTNFQPISPNHHHHNSSRPVHILKPTFLIIPKDAEQQLTAHISRSTSPVPIVSDTTKGSSKTMTKTSDTKTQEQKSTTNQSASPKVRSVEVQTNNHSPTRTTTERVTITDNTQQHIDVIATPNSSPYVHFANVSYPTQSSQLLQDGPPETSIMNDEFIQVNDYHQQTGSIRSMPNITMAQVSPHHLYGSPSTAHYHLTQQIYDEQQKQNKVALTGTESTGVRSATVPPMAPTSKATRIETGETDESSVVSLDFPHTDVIDMPGSWKYRSLPDGRSLPIATGARRHRAPIPRAFFDPQQFASDTDHMVRSFSFRHAQQQQPFVQSRPFGSIPTINNPMDSIRSQQPLQLGPSIRLNDKDILKIASFYQSIGTLVYVAHSVATLYTSDFDAMANLKDWKKLYTGVPIWLFNTGMNPKRARCIRLIISELGSSFTLWDTIVNGASDVRLPKLRHITLKSLETGTILALKFDDTLATDEFHQYFVKLSSDPRNADLFDIFNAKRRQPVFILRKRKIKKSAISKPTQFNHITKVEEHDRDSLYTYSVLVDDGAVVG